MSFLKPSINLPAISTGTSLMKMSGGLGGGGATQMSPMESMKEVFLEIRDNSKQTVELLKTAVMGTAQERKEERIGAGDTDDKEEKGPGILSKVGTTLGKLNPFGGGGMLDTLGKLVLAVGGIALLKIFGDNAVGPLADLIESIKKGKISENISKAYEYIKGVGVNAFEELKVNTILFIDGVKKVMGIIKSAYTMVNDYIMSFDTTGAEHPAGKQFGTLDEGDGKLDSKEMDALKDDLKQKAVETISTFFKDVLKSVAGGLLGLTLIGQTVKLGIAKLTPLFTGTSTTALTAGGRLAMGVPIAGLLIYGVTTTWSNISNSIKDTIEQDGEFSFSGFFANFFGGAGEGGFMNALKKGFEVGGTFALIGMAAGALIGGLATGGIGAIPGALAGGLIGTGVGFIIGAFTGWLGSDKLKAIGNHFKTLINDTIDDIRNFFTDIIDNIRSFFFGTETSYDADLKRITEDRDKEQNYLNELEASKLKNPEQFEKGMMKDIYDDQVEKVAVLNQKIKDQPEAEKKFKLEEQKRETRSLDSNLKRFEATRESNRRSLMRGISTGNEFLIETATNAIKINDAKILETQLEKKALLKNEFNVEYQIPEIENKLKQIQGLTSPNHPSNATIVANNKTNSDNTKVEQHQHGAGLMSSIGRVTSAKILASKFDVG